VRTVPKCRLNCACGRLTAKPIIWQLSTSGLWDRPS
jgi:hypothetical protein